MDQSAITNTWSARWGTCPRRVPTARQAAVRPPQVRVRTAAAHDTGVLAALPREVLVLLLQTLTAADLVRFKRVSAAARSVVETFFAKALDIAAWEQAASRWPKMERQMARSKVQLANMHSDSAIDRLVAWFGPDLRRIAADHACISLKVDPGRPIALSSLQQLLESRKLLFIRFEMDSPEALALLPVKALSDSGKRIGLACAVNSLAQRQQLHAFMRQVSVSFLSMHGADVDENAALECARQFPDTQILAISQSRNERSVHVLNIDTESERIAKAMVELQLCEDIRRYHAMGIFQMREERQVERALRGRRYYLVLHGENRSEKLLHAILACLPSSASMGAVDQYARQLRAQVIVESLDPMI